MVEEANNEQEEQLDPSLIAEEETPKQEPQEAQAPQQEDIPDKYRGKSAAELVRMHQDAERLIGKQGNEVGELRSIVNDILQAQASQPSQSAPEPEPEVSWFEDPDKATEYKVKKALEPTSKALQEVTEKLNAREKQDKLQSLLHRHPDAGQVTQQQDFLDWVGKSKARQRMYQAAANYDTDMANDLLDLWKERTQTQQTATNSAKQKRNDSIRQASTGSGKSGESVRGKPTLSRDAIVELKRTDPEKYMRMLPQLKQAYMEGRVK